MRDKMLFGRLPSIFGCHDTHEKMTLKNIKHGRVYSSCEYYPEGDEAYAPGYIKVSVETREVLEIRESEYPIWHGRYAHYAKRAILNLRADRNHCKEFELNWIKDLYSDF